MITETHGVWGFGREVAGPFNTGGVAVVSAPSCASAGNSTAGAEYAVGTMHHSEAFVVSDSSGHRRPAAGDGGSR